MRAKIGDKVRHKTAKVRGIVEGLNGDRISVRLNDGEVMVAVANELTNYSLAARKAWRNMPDRSVGRPIGTTKTDRVSVTLRIDRQLWAKFKDAESAGLIDDRTSMINNWMSAKLDELLSQQIARLERN